MYLVNIVKTKFRINIVSARVCRKFKNNNDGSDRNVTLLLYLNIKIQAKNKFLFSVTNLF